MAAQQLAIIEEIGIGVAVGLPGGDAFDLVLDGLIGYSLNGAPRGLSADLIKWANESAAPVLSLDVPSGLDTTTGTVFNPVVHASATVTLALPKEGLFGPGAAAVVGELYLADISVPRELYTRDPLRLAVAPIFARSDVVRLA